MRVWVPISIVGVLLVSAAHPAAAFSVDPIFVTFHSTSDAPAIRLTEEGRPVPQSAIRKVQLLVDGHDYTRMVRVDISDGKIVLNATEYMEVGSYDLLIQGDSGSAVVKVYTPLSEHKDIVEQQARLMNMPVEEVRKMMGLTTELSAQLASIELPPVYFEGSVLKVTLPSRPDRQYTWRINGEVVQEGAEVFEYVLPKPGEYLLWVEEKADGRTLAAVSAATTAVAKPPVELEYEAGTQVKLNGPEGYRQYMWKAGNELVASDRSHTHTFTHPGEYELMCVASGPTDGPADAFMSVVYRFTITEATGPARRPWLRPLKSEP
jgi:plastocyanin